MKNVFRLDGTTLVPLNNTAQAFGLSSGDSVLFVSPHDDDAAIGAGMLIDQLVSEGVYVHVAVVTDDRMGYFRPGLQDTIVTVRRDETLRAYNHLGVPGDHVHFLGFPDGNTWNFLGRRLAQPGDPAIEGYTGLENHLTYVVRKVKPSLIMTSALEDIHPDHKAVAMAVPIVLFHAVNGIWPELGGAVAKPHLMEYPVYRQPVGNPVRVVTSTDAFTKKLLAIAAWGTQTEIIAGIMTEVEAGGPVEYFWERSDIQYTPKNFSHLFDKKEEGTND